MRSIERSLDIETLFTVVFMLVDDWFKQNPRRTYKRSKARSDFVASAAYGYCASRSLKYYGYKLLLFSSFEGLPIAYELVPANTDERRAAEELLEQFPATQLLTDKGFIGDFWQREIQNALAVTIVCPKRRNQKNKMIPASTPH